MIDLEPVRCVHEDVTLEGTLLRPRAGHPRAAVMMIPGATGAGNSFHQAMRELADEGYLVIGVDMYGTDADISTDEAAGQHFMALLNRPDLLRQRVVAWFERVCALPGVDAQRIAAIGYCFGGKCVLELARSGASIHTVISFHGLLATHAPARPGEVKARIAVWTGGCDPYVPAADVDALREELDGAQADYQVTLFSRARHSFTDPDHDGMAEGIAYDRTAHAVAWAGTKAMLSELVAEPAPRSPSSL